MSLAFATVSVASSWPACPADSVTSPDDVEPTWPPTLCHEKIPTAVIDCAPVLVTLQNKPSLKPLARMLRPPVTARHPTLLNAVSAGGTYRPSLLMLGIVKASPLDKITICDLTIIDAG